MRPMLLLTLWAALAAPALAAPAKRDLCPSLSGLDTGPCTTEPGHLVAETVLADHTRDRQADAITDTLLIGHFLLRTGLTGTTEVQAEWVPYGHVRERDRTSGALTKRGRAGDVTLGVRQNLFHPDGEGDASAVQAFVTLPVGRAPIGAGDWGAGVVVPVAFALAPNLQVTLDPEADAAVDEDGDGRHLRYGGVVSVALGLSDAVTVQLDYEGFRDRDPAAHVTTHRAAGTLSWQSGPTFAAFVTAAAALDHDAADNQLFFGVAQRF